MNDLALSIIRTWTPILVGAVLTWLSDVLHVTDIDTVGIATAVTGLVIAVYYAAVRALEERYPAVGVLLGKPSQPKYQQAA